MRVLRVIASLALLTAIVLSPTASRAEVGLDVSFNFDAPGPVAIAPPPLPVYVVPAPPSPEVLWMPGHWQWGPYGYFWVPGTWVAAPEPGLLWTPGYWGWAGGAYAWHEGYWGSHVGFYGGVNYGGGYGGTGFHGGGWNGGHYVPNAAVINVAIDTGHAGPSFNGGPGGVAAGPTPQEQAFADEHHVPPTEAQISHVRAAGADPQMMASANHGRPAIAAAVHPGDFHAGVVAARAAGPQNAAAEQHNMQVKQNPSLAHGAALAKPMTPQMRQQVAAQHAAAHPAAQHAAAPHPQAARPAAAPHPAAHPEGVHPEGAHPEGTHPEGAHPEGHPAGHPAEHDEHPEDR